MSGAVETVATDPARKKIGAAARTETEIETAAPGTGIVIAGVRIAAAATGAVGTTTNENPSVAGVMTVAIGVATMGTAALPSATIGNMTGRRTKINLAVLPKMVMVLPRRNRLSKIRPSQDKFEEMAQATKTGHRTVAEMINEGTMIIIAVVIITTEMTEEIGTMETGVTEKMSVAAVNEKTNGAVVALVDLLRDPPDTTAQAVADLVHTAPARVIDPLPPKAGGMTTIEAAVVDTETAVIAETEIEIIGMDTDAKELPSAPSDFIWHCLYLIRS